MALPHARDRNDYDSCPENKEIARNLDSMNDCNKPKYKKIFKIRESPLSELVEKSGPLCNTNFAFILVATLCVVLQYMFPPKSISANFEMTSWIFEKKSYAFMEILFFFVCSFIQWMIIRIFDYSKTFILVQTLFATIFWAFPAYLHYKIEFSPLIGIILCEEQLRHAMKFYSLVYENMNLPRESRATFSQTVYFLFAPTLLYRPSYPRTKSRSWAKMMMFALQGICTIIIMFSTIPYFLINRISKIGREPFRLMDIIFVFPAVGNIVVFCIWYFVFHCWMNMWSELLRFGDREFYQNWWSSPSIGIFYRRWNIIVQDWLFVYIFSPFRSASNRSSAIFLTLLISALFHDYMIIIALKFIMPAFLILFAVIGQIIYYIPIKSAQKNDTKKVKTFDFDLIRQLVIGHAILAFFLSTEYYSRKNCPLISENSWLNFVYPHFWNCIKMT